MLLASQFVGILDPDVLNMLEDRGLMKFEPLQELRARYYGLDPNLLEKKQIEVATQRPMGEVVEEERQLQRTQADQAMRHNEQQYELAERQFTIAEKAAEIKKQKGPDGKPKDAPQTPKLPSGGSGGPKFDPGSLTPTARAAKVSPNGKSGAGAKSSSISGGKSKVSWIRVGGRETSLSFFSHSLSLSPPQSSGLGKRKARGGVGGEGHD